MTLDEYLAALRGVPGFSYVATPYSKYKEGIHSAFIDACKVTAALVRRGVPVYSPIVHTHPIAIYGGINPTDHELWLEADRALMDAAHGLIVVRMQGWDVSYGVAYETKVFADAGKPIVIIDPL